jgi:hypothetical protein
MIAIFMSRRRKVKKNCGYPPTLDVFLERQVCHVTDNGKAEQPKSMFRPELPRHNHRVVTTDSIDKGRYVNRQRF